MDETREAIHFSDRPRCPYCHDSIEGEGSKQGCGSCMAWHHSACWVELGQCASCGAEGSSEEGGKPAAPQLTPELKMHLIAVGLMLLLALFEVLDLSLFGGGFAGPWLLFGYMIGGLWGCWKIYGLLLNPEPSAPPTERASPKDES